MGYEGVDEMTMTEVCAALLEGRAISYFPRMSLSKIRALGTPEVVDLFVEDAVYRYTLTRGMEV